jgi:hypothetical protein
MKTALVPWSMLLVLAGPAAAQEATQSPGYNVTVQLKEKNAQGEKQLFQECERDLNEGLGARGIYAAQAKINGIRQFYMTLDYSIQLKKHWCGLVVLSLDLTEYAGPGATGVEVKFTQFAVPGKRYRVERRDAGKTYVLDFEIQPPAP